MTAQSSNQDPLASSGPLGPFPPGQAIQVDVYVRSLSMGSGNKDDLAPLLTGPPIERQYLTRDEVVSRFGADPAAIAAVETLAKGNGVDVVDSNTATRRVVLEGTAGTFEQIFGVKLLLYEQYGHTYHGVEGTITVPQQLLGTIAAVAGLDNRPAYPFVDYIVQQPPAAAQVQGVSDLDPLYAFPTAKPGGAGGALTGAGVTIGILRMGGAFDPAAAPDVVVGQDQLTQANNFPAGAVENASIETQVDINVIRTLAPGATIVLYYAEGSNNDPTDSASLLAMLKNATTDTVNKPSILSASWGIPEKGWTLPPPAPGPTTSYEPYEFDDTLRQAAYAGITACFASSDFGSCGTAPSQGPRDLLAHVVVPASCPYALGVGGTVVTVSNGTIKSEVAWNTGADFATGGGISDIFDPLPWQQPVGVPVSANKPPAKTPARQGRGVPDVAAHAAQTHYVLNVPGLQNDQYIGGTSVAAPTWAALLARITEAMTLANGRPTFPGYINAWVYIQYAAGNVAAFRDVSKGNNKQTYDFAGVMKSLPSYKARTGWDGCTGLGSPNGVELGKLVMLGPVVTPDS